MLSKKLVALIGQQVHLFGACCRLLLAELAKIEFGNIGASRYQRYWIYFMMLPGCAIDY